MHSDTRITSIRGVGESQSKLPKVTAHGPGNHLPLGQSTVETETTERTSTARPHVSETHDIPAVVIGLDSMQGLQAARILARHKIGVIGISDNRKNPCCRTRVCQQIVYAPTTEKTLIDTLAELGSQLEHKAVLYPCEDPSVLLVSRHRERLKKWYHILLPAPEVVETLMDKVSFYTFAQQNGLPIPKTHFVESRAELEEVAAELTFPCVLKPRNSATKRWENETVIKAFKLSSAEQLLAVHKQYEGCTDGFIVQEWIEGSDSDLYSCNCYFDRNSEPLVTFTARKLRQWPPETGISCLGEECRNDTVLEETIRLFQAVNYRGLGYLEMKRDNRNGKYFIVEPNIGRPTGRSAIAEAGGIELLYTMYCDLLGLPLPTDREQKYEGVKWIHLRKDLQSSFKYWRRGDLTLREWWRSLRGKKAFALASWRDPMPFLRDWTHAIRSYLSPAARKKRA